MNPHLVSERSRDSVTVLGFTTTYKYAGTAKVRVSRTRHRMLWVELWVENYSFSDCKSSLLRSSLAQGKKVQKPVPLPCTSVENILSHCAQGNPSVAINLLVGCPTSYKLHHCLSTIPIRRHRLLCRTSPPPSRYRGGPNLVRSPDSA